jgi:hypothetical protein
MNCRVAVGGVAAVIAPRPWRLMLLDPPQVSLKLPKGHRSAPIVWAKDTLLLNVPLARVPYANKDIIHTCIETKLTSNHECRAADHPTDDHHLDHRYRVLHIDQDIPPRLTEHLPRHLKVVEIPEKHGKTWLPHFLWVYYRVRVLLWPLRPDNTILLRMAAPTEGRTSRKGNGT